MKENNADVGLAAGQTGGDAAAVALLGFESGTRHWLVDLSDAGEVVPVPTLSPVPLTKPWFRGIANVRGTLYGVSDFAAFHGEEMTLLKTQSRLLLAGARAGSAQGGNIALLMSATQGLKVLSRMESLSATGSVGEPWRGASYRDSEGCVWTRLIIPALLTTPSFLDITA